MCVFHAQILLLCSCVLGYAMETLKHIIYVVFFPVCITRGTTNMHVHYVRKVWAQQSVRKRRKNHKNMNNVSIIDAVIKFVNNEELVLCTQQHGCIYLSSHKEFFVVNEMVWKLSLRRFLPCLVLAIIVYSCVSVSVWSLVNYYS